MRLDLMMIHEFALITDASHLAELPLQELYDAGCGDGYPASGNGVAYIPFGHEAATLADAIATATRDVTTAFKAAGLSWRAVRVASVDYDPFRPEREVGLGRQDVA